MKTSSQQHSLILNKVANVAAVAHQVIFCLCQRSTKHGGSHLRCSFQKRQQRLVRDIYEEVGDVYLQHAAYCMNSDTFNCLASMLSSLHHHCIIWQGTTSKELFFHFTTRSCFPSHVLLYICLLRGLFLWHHNYLWDQSHWCHQSLLVCCWCHQPASKFHKYVPQRQHAIVDIPYLKVCSANFQVLILDAALEPSMDFWFGFTTSHQSKIVLSWVKALGSYSVVEERS